VPRQVHNSKAAVAVAVAAAAAAAAAGNGLAAVQAVATQQEAPFVEPTLNEVVQSGKNSRAACWQCALQKKAQCHQHYRSQHYHR